MSFQVGDYVRLKPGEVCSAPKEGRIAGINSRYLYFNEGAGWYHDRYELVGSTPAVLYLSGPMTGLPDFNYPAFDWTADRLRESGYAVDNPAEHDGGSKDKERSYYMRLDFEALLKSDGVVVLDGWETSAGARAEVTVARELGLPIFTMEMYCPHEDYPCNGCEVGLYQWPEEDLDFVFRPTWHVNLHTVVTDDGEESIAQEAERIVNGNRNASYGHAYDDFSKTAKIWEAILGIPVTPEQVALCMVGVKISRECHLPKRDNRVDGIGYFLCLENVRAERERREEAA